MGLMLAALVVLSVIEALIWLPSLWVWRKQMAATLLLPLISVNTILVIEQPYFWVAVLTFFSIYRLINLGRLIKDRTQTDYLYHSTRRSAFWLTSFQVIDIVAAKLLGHYHIQAVTIYFVLTFFQLFAGLVLLASTLRNLRTTKFPKLTANYTDRELPALTVAIPARNETKDLEACLNSLTKSTYPKLEILVLDDCSQNKRTPEIIRDFAHDGVRFIPGEAPPDHWLAKNYSYAQLAAAANGELLLFCGVDTRFQPDSLSRLVKVMLQKKKSMISLLPCNLRPQQSNILHLPIQPNRYAWELALPRRLLKRPPVLSTCWLIKRETLNSAGGFAAVGRKIVPESYFARLASRHDDGYSFIMSNEDAGIRSLKSTEEQFATAIRTRYPQLHRRPEMVALVSLVELALLVWPLVVLISALMSGLWQLAVLSGLAFLLQSLFYVNIVGLTYRKFSPASAWLSPFAALFDISLLNYSMWQYEFREVIWKGRNICIPVMRVEAGIPMAAATVKG